MSKITSFILDLPTNRSKCRMDCPVCEGTNSLSVSNEGGSTKWYCHRASCGWRGARGGLNNRIKREEEYKSKVIPERKNKTGYSTLTIRDATHQVVGYEYRKVVPSVQGPKSILSMQPAWCGMHFPSKIRSDCILLVEDRRSAEMMDLYYPTASLMGTTLNTAKVNYLTQAGIRHVIIALDEDATSLAIHLKKTWSIIKQVYMLEKDLKDTKIVDLMDIATEIQKLEDKIK